MTETSTQSQLAPPKGKSRLGRGCGFAISGFVVLLLLCRFTPLFHPVLGNLIPWAGAKFGDLEIRFEELDTDWTHFLDLSGLEIKGRAAEAPLRSLTADHLRVEFALLDLVRGRVQGLRNVTSRNLVVDLTIPRSSQREIEKNPSAPWPALPEVLPEVDVEPFQVRLDLGDGKQVDALGGSLKVTPAGRGHQISLLDSQLAFHIPNRQLPTVPLSSSMLYDEGLIEIEALNLGEFGIRPQSILDLRDLQDKKVTWKLDIDTGQSGGPLEGTLSKGWIDSNLDLQAHLEDFAPWLPEAPNLAGQVSLSGSLKLPVEEPRKSSGRFRLEADQIRLQRLSVHRTEADLVLGEGFLEIPLLSATEPGNQLTLSEFRLPLDGKGAQDWLSTATGRLEVRATALQSLLTQTKVALEAPLPEHQLKISATIGERALRIQEGTLTVEGGSLEIRRGEVALPTLASSSKEETTLPILLDFDLDTQFTDLAPLGRLVSPSPWRGTLEGSLSTQGTWSPIQEQRNLKSQASLMGTSIEAGGFHVGDVSVQATSNGTELFVDELQAQGDWGNLRGSGMISLEDQRLRDVTLIAAVRDTGLLMPDRLRTTQEQAQKSPSLPLPKSFTFEAHLDGPWRRATGSLSLQGEGPMETGPLESIGAESFSLSAQATRGDLEIESFALLTRIASFAAAGTISQPLAGPPFRGQLEDLRIEQQGRDLTLQHPARIEIQGKEIYTEGLALRGSAGRLEVRPRQFDSAPSPLEITTTSLDPMPFVGSLLPRGYFLGTLDSKTQIHSGQNQLRITTAGKAGTLRLPSLSQNFAATWNGSLKSGIAELQELSLADEVGNSIQIRGRIPLEELTEVTRSSSSSASSPLEIQGELTAPRIDRLTLGSNSKGKPEASTNSGQADSGQANLNGSLQASFRLEGSLSDLRGRLDLQGRDLRLKANRSGTPQSIGPATVDAQLRLGASTGLAIQALRLDIPENLSLEASGNIALPTDLAAFLGPESSPKAWQDSAVKVDAQFASPDLSWARPWMTGVRRFEGSATGDLRVRGTLDAPLFEGSGELDNGSLRLASSGLAVDGLQGQVQVDSQKVQLEEIRGELGGAPFTLTGDLITSGTSPQLNLHLKGENLLLARDANLRVRSDVDLHLQGPLETLRLGGELGLRNTRVRQEIDLLALLAGGVASTVTGVAAPASSQGGVQLFSFPDAPLSTTQLDLRVRSVEPVTLTGNLAKGGARVDLRIRGTGEVPLPEGTIYLEPTEISLPSGAAKLNSGTIVFSEASPFAPELALGGTTRLRGYDIGLQLTGSLEQPEVLLSSTPPLANDELLLLVLTGQAPSAAADGLAERQAAESVALYLAKDFLVRWMGKGAEPSDSSWLDRFELIRGRDVSETGVETTEASFRLDKGFVHNSDVLYLVAEQDTFEDYNFGLRLVFRFQ